jgi:hypothetical protein
VECVHLGGVMGVLPGAMPTGPSVEAAGGVPLVVGAADDDAATHGDRRHAEGFRQPAKK